LNPKIRRHLMFKRAVTVFSVTLVAIASVSADVSDGEIVEFDDQTSLIIRDPGDGRISLLCQIHGATGEITLPRETDSIFAQHMSFGRIRHVQSQDPTHIWIIAHLSPRMGAAFLFNLSTEEFEAELAGTGFEISPSGRHVAHFQPHTAERTAGSLRVNGVPLFDEEGMEQLGDDLRIFSEIQWGQNDTLEIEVESPESSNAPRPVVSRLSVRLRPGTEAVLTDGSLRDAESPHFPQMRIALETTLTPLPSSAEERSLEPLTP
jgi:hypothetical protein